MANIQSELSPDNIDTTSTIAANYDVSSYNNNSSIVDLLNKYLPQIGNQQIVLDTGVLVGNTAPAYNTAFGKLNTRRT